MRHQMHDIPFPLDTSVDAEHAGTEDNAAMLLEGLNPTTRVDIPIATISHEKA
jgi:hypothetical protein